MRDLFLPVMMAGAMGDREPRPGGKPGSVCFKCGAFRSFEEGFGCGHENLCSRQG